MQPNDKMAVTAEDCEQGTFLHGTVKKETVAVFICVGYGGDGYGLTRNLPLTGLGAGSPRR